MKKKSSLPPLEDEREQVIEIIGDESRIKINEKHPILKRAYSPNSLLTKKANDNLETLMRGLLPDIKDIVKRKGLSINEVCADPEISEILERRDVELRLLNNRDYESLIRKKEGRPSNRKNKVLKVRYDDKAIDKFIQSYFEAEKEEPTQQQAATSLGFGYEKKLQRMRRLHGDKRDWKVRVNDVLSLRK